jgi:hypothetical protein
MTLDEQLAEQDASYEDTPSPTPSAQGAASTAVPPGATPGGTGVGLDPQSLKDLQEHTARLTNSQNQLARAQAELAEAPNDYNRQASVKHWSGSVGAATNIINDYMANKNNWGRADADPNVDYSNELDGAFGFRAGLGTKDSIEERINHLTKNAGPENVGWRRLRDGTVVITPQGHRNLGVEPPKHGRDVPLDSKSTATWGDLADMSGEVGTTLGSAAAGFATGGPIGGLLGMARGVGTAVLGAGAGSLAQEGIEEVMGENMQSPMEVLGDTALDAGVGAIGAPIRGTTGVIGRRALAPFGEGSPQMLRDVTDAYSRGFTPSAGGINESTLFAYLENFSQRLMGDKDRLAKNTTAASDNFAQAAGKDVSANPINQETFGTYIRDRVKGKRTQLSQWAKGKYDPLFEKLNDVGGGVPIPMDSFAKEVKVLLDEGMKNSKGKTVGGLSKAARAELQDLADLAGTTATPGELHTLRTHMREAAVDDKLFPDSSRRHLTILKKKLDGMLDPDELGRMYKDAGMGTLYPGQRKLLDELKATDKQYGKDARNLDIAMLERIAKDPTSKEGVAPEQVASVLFDGEGGRHVNASTLKALRKVFTPHQMEQVQHLGYERMAKVLMQPGDAVDTLALNPTGFKRMLADIGPAPLREMYGALGAAELNNLARAIQLTLGTKQKASGLALAAVALNPLKNLGTIARMGALEWLLSKSASRKWLTVGISAPKTRKGVAAINSIATAVALHQSAGDGTSGGKIPDEGPN